jgi:hypothetical protein
MRISGDLQQKLLAEEEEIHAIKQNLQYMEKEIYKRMGELSRGEI